MARRQYKRLTTTEIKKLVNTPGRHPDGDGLYLQVGESGVASWVLRYLVGVTADGKKQERFMGLGPLRRVSLAEARRRAEAAHRQRDAGADPIEAKKAARLDRRLSAVKAMTFADCARAYIKAHQTSWRNALHTRQWPQTLETYVYPIFGDLPVSAVDTALVLKALEPIWHDKTETASRVRGRIESVLDWATTRGYRPEGANPARWRGHLANTLPKPSKAKQAARQAAGRDEHHAALPYVEIAGFVTELRQQDGVAARALEFAILTAGRTGEIIGARWDEFGDLTERLWTIPPERMKKGDKEHRVPLSDAAMAILAKMDEIRASDFVFPGMTPGKPLSNMAMLALLRRMGRKDLTVHGFRSTFSDWCAEQTRFPSELREMALAHTIGNKAEAAYRRGDMFAKRRQLAAAWSRYCGQPRGQVALRAR